MKLLSFAVITALIFCACSPGAPEGGAATESSEVRTVADVQEPRPFRMSEGRIVADTFDLQYDLRDGQITLVLLTDLGDAATVMVSVSRGYRERGSTEEYSVDYFSERSKIAEWRQPRLIRLDHANWKQQLEQRQRILAAAGEPFTVSRIDDDIEISFVVPVNQDAPFERMNANLVGAVVTQRGNLRIVERRIATSYPIDATGVGQTRFADPLSLSPGSVYRPSREVPLMPQFEPTDPLEAIGSMQRIPAGEEFTVIEARDRRGAPWYHVRSGVGNGWINSTALIGQEVVEVR
jgi:hypothetical protein